MGEKRCQDPLLARRLGLLPRGSRHKGSTQRVLTPFLCPIFAQPRATKFFFRKRLSASPVLPPCIPQIVASFIVAPYSRHVPAFLGPFRLLISLTTRAICRCGFS